MNLIRRNGWVLDANCDSPDLSHFIALFGKSLDFPDEADIKARDESHARRVAQAFIDQECEPGTILQNLVCTCV